MNSPRHRLSHLDNKKIVGFTRRAIRDKEAYGYGRKVFGPAEHAKDWTKKEVRQRLEHLVERNIFSTRVDSRKNLINFFNRAFIESCNSSKSRVNIISDLTRVYFNELVEARRPKNRALFAESVVLTFELISERIDHLVNEIRVIDYEGRNPKNVSELKQRYYRRNARDAFSHIATQLMAFQDVALVAIEVLKKEVAKNGG